MKKELANYLNKTVYLLERNDCGYSEILKIFDDEKDCQKEYCKLTNLPMFTPEDYQKNLTKNTMIVNGERYGIYYEIESINLLDFINEDINRQIDKSIWDKTEEIQKKGNELIERETEKEVMKKVSEILTGGLFYLKENDIINIFDYDNFEKQQKYYNKYKK